jgi:sigma-B regulation protein RsbU (phosphoserine phosphatase)
MAVKREVVLPTPVYTLTDFDRAARRARFMVASDGPAAPGEAYALVPALLDPLAWTFEDGIARYTPVYQNQHGTWITAFAPIVDASGRTIAVLDLDYPVEIYLDRLRVLRVAILQGALAGAVAALLVGVVFARRLTRPLAALTAGVARVAAGALDQTLAVRSRDEIGRLTEAFNEMVEGLRQRDFIRNTFGRYVSPEVAKAILESPEGLRFGGEKRVVTILMSDLRGYTRFAEDGDPAWVMEVLNGYLSRMTEIVVEHGGTINEFIGDAIFAVYGAPLAYGDHAERAAATALAMQRAMAEINAANAAQGLPRFEMGIGVHTGEAVVGNIGSEARAKYAVVGSAVNTAARVESATVGGQIYLSAAALAPIQPLAEVGPPVSVQVKGLSEPLVLHELRGLSGRFAQRLPAEDEAPAARAALPLTCWVFDGKVATGDPHAGTTVRVSARWVEARVSAALPALTNVRLRLRLADGRETGDLYGKVVEAAERDGAPLVRIHLTSIGPDDRARLEALVG